MSRVEADKEDLIRDATALVHRGEFAFTAPMEAGWEWQVVTIGFRANGSPSFYFDQDPFYQFDADGRLRRAYSEGFLYRSQSSTLARMHRTRTSQMTTLQRYDLSPAQLAAFHECMLSRMTALQTHLQTGTLKCQRMVCPEGNLLERTLSFVPIVLQHRHSFLSTSINQR
jgi:hypothetical protein